MHIGDLVLDAFATGITTIKCLVPCALSSLLTGHTDVIGHLIDTGDHVLINYGQRRLYPIKIEIKNKRVDIQGISADEVLLGSKTEPNDSPCLVPTVLVTKKEGATRFCVDYHVLNKLKMPFLFTLLVICWIWSWGSSGYRLLTWPCATGRLSYFSLLSEDNRKNQECNF
jgi:hypothetical protein